MLSVHPDAATRQDVAQLAAELMECRRLLCHVWNHMHGQDMNGTRRPWPGEAGCAQNWNRLSDAIGFYLDLKTHETNLAMAVPQSDSVGQAGSKASGKKGHKPATGEFRLPGSICKPTNEGTKE